MWLKEDGDETRMVECEITKVFAEISCLLYDELIIEMLSEVPFKKGIWIVRICVPRFKNDLFFLISFFRQTSPFGSFW